jgi:hypothetical protein
MAHTRKEIEALRAAFKAKPILQELIEKVNDDIPISLAEEDYVCSMMRILRQGQGMGELVYNINSIPACDNYRFRKTYIMYAHDLDGKGLIRDYYGRVANSVVKEDVEYLTKSAKDWERQMSVKNKNERAMWNYMIEETGHQLHILDNFIKSALPSKDEIAYQRKSIFLHSRFIYLQVYEFFQDQGYNERLQVIYDLKILVDPFCFIHTLFRHFASGVKGYQIGQSYHFDATVLYKELPNFLSRFLRIYGKNIPKRQFNSWTVDFIYRGKHYTIYLRPFNFKGSKTLRIQTFFPLEEKRHLMRVQSRKKVKINRKLTFLVPWDV